MSSIQNLSPTSVRRGDVSFESGAAAEDGVGEDGGGAVGPRLIERLELNDVRGRRGGAKSAAARGGGGRRRRGRGRRQPT